MLDKRGRRGGRWDINMSGNWNYSASDNFIDYGIGSIIVVCCLYITACALVATIKKREVPVSRTLFTVIFTSAFFGVARGAILLGVMGADTPYAAYALYDASSVLDTMFSAFAWLAGFTTLKRAATEKRLMDRQGGKPGNPGPELIAYFGYAWPFVIVLIMVAFVVYVFAAYNNSYGYSSGDAGVMNVLYAFTEYGQWGNAVLLLVLTIWLRHQLKKPFFYYCVFMVIAVLAPQFLQVCRPTLLLGSTRYDTKSRLPLPLSLSSISPRLLPFGLPCQTIQRIGQGLLTAAAFQRVNNKALQGGRNDKRILIHTVDVSFNMLSIALLVCNSPFFMQ